MTKIDFYILGQKSRDNRFSLACRIADKAWQQGHRVLIHTNSEDESRHMDRLLWTYRDGSFIPHALCQEPSEKEDRVLVGHEHTLADGHGGHCGHGGHDENDVLINLANTQPDFFSRFNRVAECIDKDETIKASGRQRFRYYKERGYPLSSHDID